MATGIFVGLTTLDLIYLSQQLPAPDQKLVASDYTIAAGGPATNAAVTFAYLGNRAKLFSAIGCHPLARTIRTDLDRPTLQVFDLAPDRVAPPPVSSIVVTAGTGERAVISINATRSQLDPVALPADALNSADIFAIDGHQMSISRELARQARDRGIPVAIDGGSWKPGFETVLPFVDYAVCSANFFPPGCCTHADVFACLAYYQIPHIAITHGSQAIAYRSNGNTGERSVPAIEPVDTLGAGDIFHGAFYHYILREPFPTALTSAARIAARACQSFGPRQWMLSNSP
ncbi:sugar kinase, ribokinase family [Rubidibacter lacunae KORDI 51-2]|uniref:Sugar kinase, ribokinase family n=1 Tax=Rubidibacter lacunae KORDI 51-2 TaxID=582515 RepID=U5DC73_9CHRO|nr:PfkB family carbohydrate kinase [Rubidibacter lacunae]ERN42123.1 sugar kinase, ribokinase family [Rubidibacter lacunae KORDI 51-2]